MSYSVSAEVDCKHKSQIPPGFKFKLYNCYILEEDEEFKKPKLERGTHANPFFSEEKNQRQRNLIKIII